MIPKKKIVLTVTLFSFLINTTFASQEKEETPLPLANKGKKVLAASVIFVSSCMKKPSHNNNDISQPIIYVDKGPGAQNVSTYEEPNKNKKDSVSINMEISLLKEPENSSYKKPQIGSSIVKIEKPIHYECTCHLAESNYCKSCKKYKITSDELCKFVRRGTSSLKADLSNLRTELNEQVLTMRQLKRNNIKIKKYAEMLEECQFNSDQQIAELKNKNTYESLKNKKLEEENEYMQKKMNHIKKKLKKTQSSKKELEKEVKQKDYKIMLYEKALKAKDSKIAQLRNKLANREHEISNKEHELEIKKKELANKEHELEIKKSRLASKRNELVNAISLIASQEAKIQSLNNILNNKESQINIFKEKYTKEKEKKDKIIKKVSSDVAENVFLLTRGIPIPFLDTYLATKARDYKKESLLAL